MNWTPVITVVGPLGACLVALLLVQLARREAEAVRRRAADDVTSIKEEAHAKLADAERREQRLAEREQALAQDRGEVESLERRTHERAEALVLTGVAVTYVPWLFLPERTVFQFYTVAILPFMLLALTFALQDVAQAHSSDSYRRLTGQRLVLVFLGVALALSAFWYPIISAMTVPYDFWHLHMWMPSWV